HKRKRFYDEEKDYISLITLDCDYCKQDDFKEWKNIMTETLEMSLRRGDVFTFWNDTQAMIILSDVRDHGPQIIETRIRNNLPKNMEYKLNINFKTINAESKYTIESPI